MSPITSGQRVFFAVICAAALLVAILGLFNPTYLASIFTGMLIFTVTAVIISFLHIGLFSFNELPDLLWFGWFILASLILIVLTFQALQAHESS